MMDNAPYHTCTTSMQLYGELNIPILFTGPHSYSASPVELFFAAFKSVDINPERLKIRKR